MSKLTTVEKFYKIVDKLGVAGIGEITLGNEVKGYDVRSDSWVGPTRETKDEAIEAAFKELFPLIPRSVGEGDEEWKWTGSGWQSICLADAHVFRNGKGQIVYVFGVNIQAIGSGGESFDGQPQYITAAAISGFRKLIDINPELGPPTEE